MTAPPSEPAAQTGAPTGAGGTQTTYREALREAHRDALTRDPRVFLMGEDVGCYGGSFAVSLGLLEEFGPERIRDTPLSESAFTGAGIGAALGGMRPIVEIMTVNFSLLALDQILNNAATLLNMSGGQLPVPLVIRMTTGAGRQVAAQHSHSLEGWYAHIPGLRVLAPATIEDARGMLWPALQDPDPVLIFELGSLYNLKGTLPAGAAEVDITRAAVRRRGTDVTLVTYGGSLGKGYSRVPTRSIELFPWWIQAEVAAERVTVGPATNGRASRHVTAERAADQRAADMRNSIAALMSRSKREIPHYYLSTTVDLQRTSAARHRWA